MLFRGHWSPVLQQQCDVCFKFTMNSVATLSTYYTTFGFGFSSCSFPELLWVRSVPKSKIKLRTVWAELFTSHQCTTLAFVCWQTQRPLANAHTFYIGCYTLTEACNFDEEGAFTDYSALQRAAVWVLSCRLNLSRSHATGWPKNVLVGHSQWRNEREGAGCVPHRTVLAREAANWRCTAKMHAHELRYAHSTAQWCIEDINDTCDKWRNDLSVWMHHVVTQFYIRCTRMRSIISALWP